MSGGIDKCNTCHDEGAPSPGCPDCGVISDASPRDFGYQVQKQRDTYRDALEEIFQLDIGDRNAWTVAARALEGPDWNRASPTDTAVFGSSKIVMEWDAAVPGADKTIKLSAAQFWEREFREARDKKSVINAERVRLKAENKALVDALDFIASGCLVPPDGGSPRLEDAMQTAKEALRRWRP